MKNNIYLQCLLLFLLCSCNNKEADKFTPEKVLEINLNNRNATISEFSDKIEHIKLITLKDSTLFYLNQIVTKDEKYYVADKNQGRIFKFNSNGECEFLISKKGKAKDEYLSIGDISITNDCIRIYDNMSSKFIDYDINNGTFIRSSKLNDNFSNVVSYNDIIVGYNSLGDTYFSPKMISVYDSLFNKTHSYINIESYLKGVSIRQHAPLIRYNSEILLTRILSNDVYRISKDTIDLKYRFDFGKYNLSDDILKRISDNEASNLLLRLINSDYVNSIDYFLETDEFIYFVFMFKGKMNVLYYNKLNDNYLILNGSSIDENNRMWAMNPHISTNEKGEFISVLNPSIFNNDSIEFFTNTNCQHFNNAIDNVIKNNNEEYISILLYSFK